MEMAHTSAPDELAEVEAALDDLETVSITLRAVIATVGRLVKDRPEPTSVPNLRRAYEQLHVAVNATAGAQRSLRRRLERERE